MTQNIFRKMNKNEQAELLKNKFEEAARESVDGDLSEFSNRLKNTLKQDYERILDGNSQTGHRKYLRDVYTELFVVENETGGVVNEHEVRQIEINRTAAEDSPIKCSDLFKVQPDTGRQNRKVLTMGIAGVGKTVSVNKFILDWAEGKKNQEIDFIFPLPLRQLNLVQKDYSLMELIHKYFFSSTARPPLLPEEKGKVMFIFDGLDECRFPLSFEQSEKFTDVHEKTTVDVIVTNLIERNLLPSALIWITSRPAAASLIPRDYIDQVTEVRGFNDEQKEKYFTKNSSPEVAEKIMSHIKKSRSLYIMCHIPVFCWISLSVLQPLLARENQNTIPTTLTGMYIYFLLQMQQLTKKYDGAVQSFEGIVLKLGKLAFEQLQKGILIFYKEDLEEYGLDVKEGLIFSGLCTRLFQIEKTVSERGVYSFVHLSVQEFLAALYVFLIYQHKKQNSFLTPSFLEGRKKRKIKCSLLELHETAVRNALQSKNGHLDLLLRFLMGLSLRSNQENLMELLPTLKITSENMERTADYIKMRIVDEESAEKSINLFYCLSELKNDSLQTEIQRFLSKGGTSAKRISSLHWSALLFVLMTSDETQEMFEMQKYGRSYEDLIQFLPVIKYTRRALATEL
ncbi:Nucleotide-binding oligomerization domain-containing protein 2 [Triplophysa tibetana]|uniref:Nucleotide-binding oligomerization domain-containing protein 2 n=1 Tax=Triplophysa tibetana TaxID=1572043 RepID=A0A5A9NJ61_9TELE|nr:Nucleotide-binding oligomerization domain-containing protein 2 [Triplophysa tibetana]